MGLKSCLIIVVPNSVGVSVYVCLCHSSGLSYAVGVNEEFGRGTGVLVLGNLQCNGTEPNLLSCRTTNSVTAPFTGCSSTSDAAVICSGEYY